jgi:hypothetical protein
MRLTNGRVGHLSPRLVTVEATSQRLVTVRITRDAR